MRGFAEHDLGKYRDRRRHSQKKSAHMPKGTATQGRIRSSLQASHLSWPNKTCNVTHAHNQRPFSETCRDATNTPILPTPNPSDTTRVSKCPAPVSLSSALGCSRSASCAKSSASATLPGRLARPWRHHAGASEAKPAADAPRQAQQRPKARTAGGPPFSCGRRERHGSCHYGEGL